MGSCIEQKLTVAFAGNPNVGKSILFNALTGLRQHTGNWSGKTVGAAVGRLKRDGTEYTLVDLPGTYSLTGESEDERLAGEYILQGEADCLVVICDGSCLERSLILALQILQKTEKVVVCVNLMDEAKRKGIEIDAHTLETFLQTPVVLTAAEQGKGIGELMLRVRQTALQPQALRQNVWEDPVTAAERIAQSCVRYMESASEKFRLQVDKLLVSRRFGMPLMGILFLGIVWFSVWGAEYPGAILEAVFQMGYGLLQRWMVSFPPWLRGIMIDGIYGTSAKVICVMLPPFAIFFPLFTVLEDIGYLPRAAFLLDPCMAACGGCGRQALTLCMGLGCNAVGVMGCRIIDCPRKRLAAILTNSMVPCNGRFPSLIFLGSLFFSGAGGALAVAACVALGAAGAIMVSGVLNKTVLHTGESTFIMELPPFRRPRLGRILIRSLLDRTLRIAGRTLTVAAPAGALLWIISNTPLLNMCVGFLDPVGVLLGLNGVILFAFIMSLPANELLIPVILMTLSQTGSLQGAASLEGQILLQSGMTWQMAVCTMVFTLFHWPCATTLMTIYRETGSMKRTAVAFLLPTGVGCVLCILLRIIF